MTALAKRYVSLVEAEIEAKGITRSEPQIPLFSSVTDEVIENSAMLGPKYWRSNLTSSVRFYPAVSRILRHQPQNILLEIGPHATLAGPLRQIFAEAPTSLLTYPNNDSIRPLHRKLALCMRPALSTRRQRGFQSADSRW
jgi:acyl transferase domain-containing protein